MNLAKREGRLGAKGGTRTHTALGHWLLRPARLPIPPLSRKGEHIKKDRDTGSSVLASLLFGAPTRTRTWNQQIKSLLLYQLSYGGSGIRCNHMSPRRISNRGGGF